MRKFSFSLLLAIAVAVMFVAAWSAQNAQAVALADVSEIGRYKQVYQIDLPNGANWNSTPITYNVNNSSTLTLPFGFDRIGYYLELQSSTGTRQWVWASATAFTNQLSKTGIPNVASGAFFQQNLANMNVESNVAGIATGTNLTTGNIEFWPSNYGGQNDLNVPNASPTTFDFGDGGANGGAGYGSMQIGNYDLDGAGPGTAGQTIFAYNGWGQNTTMMGIGNQPTGNPDWTFADNQATWTLKSLEVWVSDPLLGAVLQATPADDSTIDLGSVGDNGGTLTLNNAIELENVGASGTIIQVTGYSITGSDASSFALTNFTPNEILAAGGSTTYGLTFNGVGDVRGYNALLTLMTTAGDINYTLSAGLVPEPSTGAMFLLGLGVVMLKRRSRRSEK